MGGSGSGRYSGFRATTTDDMHSIDLAWLRKKGILKQWWKSSITWSRGGQVTSAIGIKPEGFGLRLIYSVGPEGDKISIDELVPYTYTDTNFGGRRQWFKCLSCNRRCRVIYGGRYFRCRKCYDLKYETQYEPPWGRATTRSINIRKKLGCDGGIEDPFPLKPKGMHWKTYRKLEAEYEHGYEVWARLCMNWLDRYSLK